MPVPAEMRMSGLLRSSVMRKDLIVRGKRYTGKEEEGELTGKSGTSKTGERFSAVEVEALTASKDFQTSVQARSLGKIEKKDKVSTALVGKCC